MKGIHATEGDTMDRQADRTHRVSERKIQANRVNAQHSTGPKTADGKRRVARNAVRHGILAREVFIGEGDGAESEEDFSALRAGLYARYAPRDVAEQLEVENLAAAYWMLRRAYRAATGDTRTGLDPVRLDWEQSRRQHFEAQLATAALDRGATLRTSSLGCAYLLRVLDTVAAEVATGHLSPTTLESWREHFPPSVSAPIPAGRRTAGEATPSFDADSLDEEGWRELAALVASQRAAVERAHAEAERREHWELSAEAARLALPGPLAGERALRYIVALRKDIARGHAMLATWEARRTGPPPMANAPDEEGPRETTGPTPRG